VAADAIGVNEFARNVVPAARANSKVRTSIELMPEREMRDADTSPPID
jgi:hypothetical protein